MPYFTHSLCGCRLETFTKIWGWLGIVQFSAIILGLFISGCLKLSNNDSSINMTAASIILGIIGAIIGVIVCVLLLFAIRRKDRRFLVPYLIFEIIFIVILAIIIVRFIVLSFVDSPEYFVDVIVMFIEGVFAIYFYLLIYSYWQELGEQPQYSQPVSMRPVSINYPSIYQPDVVNPFNNPYNNPTSYSANTSSNVGNSNPESEQFIQYSTGKI